MSMSKGRKKSGKLMSNNDPVKVESVSMDIS